MVTKLSSNESRQLAAHVSAETKTQSGRFGCGSEG